MNPPSPPMDDPVFAFMMWCFLALLVSPPVLIVADEFIRWGIDIYFKIFIDKESGKDEYRTSNKDDG